MKTPTKVVNIGPVQQAACGVAHSLALGIDGLTVWSFGSGDSGKLGHGDTTKQTTPKVCTCIILVGERWGGRGRERDLHMYVRTCAYLHAINMYMYVCM